jgi:hypothetical protein
LRRDSQVVGLILKSIKALTTLRDLVDVVTHHTHGVINLLFIILAYVQVFKRTRHSGAGVSATNHAKVGQGHGIDDKLAGGQYNLIMH